MPSLKKHFIFLVGWTVLFLPLVVAAFLRERDMLPALCIVFAIGDFANSMIAGRAARQVCNRTWSKQEQQKIAARSLFNRHYLYRPKDERGERLWKVCLMLNLLSALALFILLLAPVCCAAIQAFL